MGEAVLFPRMGTIKEAADASGLAIYRVRHLVASGKIRYIRAGRRILDKNCGLFSFCAEQK